MNTDNPRRPVAAVLVIGAVAAAFALVPATAVAATFAAPTAVQIAAPVVDDTEDATCVTDSRTSEPAPAAAPSERPVPPSDMLHSKPVAH